MRESPSPSLLEDLERCRALAADDAAYEREVVRWLPRLAFERDACPDTVQPAARAPGVRAGRVPRHRQRGGRRLRRPPRRRPGRGRRAARALPLTRPAPEG